MTNRILRHRPLSTIAALGVLIGAVAGTTPAAAEAQDTPRRGGMLLAASGADAPSLDPHSRQARTLDPVERRKLVIDLQKIVLENAYHMPGLWWSRNVVHWAKVRNWVAPPSHFTNQKLQDVWLAED